MNNSSFTREVLYDILKMYGWDSERIDKEFNETLLCTDENDELKASLDFIESQVMDKQLFFNHYNKKRTILLIAQQEEENISRDLDEIKVLASMKETKTKAVTKMYQYLLKRFKFITLMGNEEIYYFQGGIYNPNGASFIKMKIKEFIEEKDNSFFVQEVIQHIKRSTMKTLQDVEPPLNLILFENGILNTGTLKLEEFNSDYLFLTKIDYPFNPEVKPKYWIEFLKQVLPDEIDRLVIQEVAGYPFVREYTTIEKAFILVGGGNNGKSTFLNTLVKLYGGAKNVSALSFQKITDEKDTFALANLHQKLANIYTDLPQSTIKDTGRFKMTMGGQMLQEQIKFGGFISFVNYAKHIFSSNNPPTIQDDSDGTYRKWQSIKFTQSFEGKEDRTLKDKLATKEELSGILNWALEGLQRLMKDKKLTKEKTAAENRAEYIMAADSIAAFWSEGIEQEPMCKISKELLYKVYCDYCLYNKLSHNSNDKFFKTLKDYNGKYRLQEMKVTEPVSKERFNVYSGIKFNDGVDMPKNIITGENSDKTYFVYKDLVNTIQSVQPVQPSLYSRIYEIYTKVYYKETSGQAGHHGQQENIFFPCSTCGVIPSHFWNDGMDKPYCKDCFNKK